MSCLQISSSTPWIVLLHCWLFSLLCRCFLDRKFYLSFHWLFFISCLKKMIIKTKAIIGLPSLIYSRSFLFWGFAVFLYYLLYETDKNPTAVSHPVFTLYAKLVLLQFYKTIWNWKCNALNFFFFKFAKGMSCEEFRPWERHSDFHRDCPNLWNILYNELFKTALSSSI